MTSFEKILVDRGYVKFTYHKNKFIKPKYHIISTMVNLCHMYFHNSDPIVYKIENNLPITLEDRKNEICFGLHEVGKPSTLIYPRPNIKTIQTTNNIIFDRGINDDIMNNILSKYTFDEIFESMFNREKILIQK